MHHAFYNERKLFFGLEYCQGGELFNLLQNKNKLKDYDMSHIQGFKTRDKHFIIDYILSKKNLNLRFLKNKLICVVPLFKESKLNAVYCFK